MATAENSVALLKSAIAKHGKPKDIIADHGSQSYANKGDKKQNTQFRIVLDALGIKYHLTRVNRPQTNGKVKRFFLTYKIEHATGTFCGIKDFIKCYNEVRLHMISIIMPLRKFGKILLCLSFVLYPTFGITEFSTPSQKLYKTC